MTIPNTVEASSKDTLTASIENHIRLRAQTIGVRAALTEASEAFNEAQKRVGFQYPGRVG